MSQSELVRLERIGNRNVIRFTQRNLSKRLIAQNASEQISVLLATNFGAAVSPQEATNADDDRSLEIDFGYVQAISSATLSGLIQIHREARVLGVSLELVNMIDPVREIFKLTRLDRLFMMPKIEMV
ncbi:MAG: STAS domain-containing protein [Pirellulaceae bacterium]